MSKTSRRRWAAVVALPGLACALVACGAGSGSEGSRVRLYDSPAAMADDSSVVLVGNVVNQRTARDLGPSLEFTISSVEVLRVVDGETSGGASTVEVRQDDSTPIIEEGRPYLLYLTASGLDGALASQYYVTGAGAGLYVSNKDLASTRQDLKAKKDEGLAFKQLKKHEGENLPAEVTLAEVDGAR